MSGDEVTSHGKETPAGRDNNGSRGGAAVLQPLADTAAPGGLEVDTAFPLHDVGQVRLCVRQLLEQLADPCATEMAAVKRALVDAGLEWATKPQFMSAVLGIIAEERDIAVARRAASPPASETTTTNVLGLLPVLTSHLELLGERRVHGTS